MVDLSSLLPKGKSNAKNFFWSIVIEPNWIQAAIWTISDSASEVISVSKSVPWSEDAEFVDAADTALSSAVQNLEDDIDDPSATVFGLPHSWIDGGQIKDEYLVKIKNLCGELSLDPKGFVVLPEAISHFIKSKEESDFTGVVIGIWDEVLEISLFDAGSLRGVENVARSVSVVDDVVEGLARLSKDEPVASRFVIYNSKEGELEETRQTLVQQDWDEIETVSFLHTPKVEVVSPEEKMLAVSLAGGAEIADVKSVFTANEGDGEDARKEEPEPEDEIGEAPETGFVVGEDIAKDIKDEDLYSDNIANATEVQDDFDETEFVQKDQEPPDQNQRNIPKPNFAAILAPLQKFLGKFRRKPSRGDPSPSKRIIIVGTLLLLLLIISGFLFWYFYPKAEVVVYVSPRKLEERLEISIDPDTDSINEEERVIPGRVVSVTSNGSKTKSTTGTKTVGERASGTVEIRNGTSSSVRAPAGTILVADGGLEFETVNSASVSAALSPSNPGSETVEVRAADIGSEYNVSGDTSFAVGNFPKAEVDAVAQGDFSGGSSEEVAAVSSQDIETLERELTEELEGSAIEKLKADVGNEEQLIEESLEAEASDTSFSASAGDEASSVKLDLAIEANAVVVPKDALNQLARQTLEEQIPGGYSLRDEQLDIDFNFQEEEDGVYVVEAFIVANLLPEVNPDEITDKIRGKYIHVAQEYLNTIPGFTRVEIVLTPKLPGRLGNIPYVAKNISVEIAAER